MVTTCNQISNSLTETLFLPTWIWSFLCPSSQVILSLASLSVVKLRQVGLVSKYSMVLQLGLSLKWHYSSGSVMWLAQALCSSVKNNPAVAHISATFALVYLYPSCSWANCSQQYSQYILFTSLLLKIKLSVPQGSEKVGHGQHHEGVFSRFSLDSW